MLTDALVNVLMIGAVTCAVGCLMSLAVGVIRRITTGRWTE